MKKIRENFWKASIGNFITGVLSADLLLPAKDNEVPLHWVTGRVTETHTQNDDVFRVCKVETGISTRYGQL